MTESARELEEEGRVWFRAALSEEALADLDALAEGSGTAGIRISDPEPVAAINRALAPLAAKVLPGARPVRLTLFDKSAATNWSLPWHQDRVIAVAERYTVEGYTNWSRKDGLWHVEPPADLLAGMLFARVHLDPADADGGAMELALGSHRWGRVASGDAGTVADRCRQETCVAARGDILFVKALTLHRSATSRSGAARRALRVDYALATHLAPPLTWALAASV